jgi:hypothetical protein
MNKEQISNMPAGREMDALIAERVMGMQWYSWTDEAMGGIIRGLRFPDRFSYAVLEFYERTTIEYPALEPYSTDVKAAWGVVEKMTPLYRFGLAQVESGRFWFAQFENIEHFGEWEAFESEDETAPLAICRAALLAVLEHEHS